MNLLPMREGGLDDHLGLSHTWFHYLAPPEMWEDIAPDDLPADARPRAAWEALLPHPPPAPACAPRLRLAFHQGYHETVRRLAARLPDPSDGAVWSKHPTKPRLRRAHAGDGVVLYVGSRHELHTAFRPLDFVLTDYRCPPRDARSVSLRRSLALAQATAYLAIRTSSKVETP